MNALNPVRRVGDQVAEPVLLHGGSPGGRDQARVSELLELVGISPERAQRVPAPVRRAGCASA